MLTEDVKASQKVSDENRIGIIREVRNKIINHFLVELNLIIYFKKHFKYKPTAIRIEFIKKELQDLLISPVDLVHYSSLLMEMKHAGVAFLTIKNEDLFYEELNEIFKKYVN